MYINIKYDGTYCSIVTYENKVFHEILLCSLIRKKIIQKYMKTLKLVNDMKPYIEIINEIKYTWNNDQNIIIVQYIYNIINCIFTKYREQFIIKNIIYNSNFCQCSTRYIQWSYKFFFFSLTSNVNNDDYPSLCSLAFEFIGLVLLPEPPGLLLLRRPRLPPEPRPYPRRL